MSNELEKIFLNTKLGIQDIYNNANLNGLSGISLNEITNLIDESSDNAFSFANYLKNNLDNIDKDSNDVISQKELNSLFSKISYEGLTYEQFFALQNSPGFGMDQSVIAHIMQNFQKIDVNGDGKVSDAELKLYKVKNEIAERDKNGPKTEEKSSFYEENEPVLGIELNSKATLSSTSDPTGLLKNIIDIF